MKKQIFLYACFIVPLILLSSLYKGWLSLSFWPLWVGAIVGVFLPGLDSLVYVFFLRPYELSSQRVIALFKNRNYLAALSFMSQTNYERTNLIFHKAYFQIIFLVLTFLVVSSSSSLLGRGIVLAFYLHLLLDQLSDFLNNHTLQNWFSQLPLNLSYKQNIYYLVGSGLLLLIFAFLF